MSKVVFVSGPYSAADGWTQQQNINRAWRAASKLAKAGIQFFCPHTNSGWMDESQPAEWWYKMDADILTRLADGILMLDGWEHSKGAKQELALACDQGMPVFYSIQEVCDSWQER